MAPQLRRLLLRLLTTAILVLATLAGLWRLSDARSVQLFGRLVSHVPVDQRVVALTFDDGPNRRHTDAVLELLRERRVRATFFLIGREVADAPHLAAAIAADGHELGNHSFSHRPMVFMSPSTVRAEVERADSAIRATGYGGPLHFRPPYGKKLLALPWYLARSGRTTITWDIEPESYPDVVRDPARIVHHVADRVRPGSIILLHVMYDSRATSRAALGPLIDTLARMNYRFVTVSELLQLAPPAK